MPLRFLLFSWLILIRKMTSGGVLESSGSPLVDGHRDFFKIDAKMAEKIEVEVGTLNTEINFLTVCHFPNEGCQLQLQFSQPFLHRF